MKERLKKQTANLILIAVFLLLTAAFTYAVKHVDVALAGDVQMPVGFSTWNQAVHDFFGVHMVWYTITDVLGLVAMGVGGIFGFVGLFQWIQRKNMWKVDRTVLTMGGLYIVAICMYVFFEIVVVNYRPVLMPGCTTPEASFPSSHTVLSLVIYVSVFSALKEYIKKKPLLWACRILCLILIAVTLVGRLICGVHWASDIFASLLYSTTFLLCFRFAKRV